MLLELQVPGVTELVREATVLRVLVEPGTHVERGTRLVEMRVDLGKVVAQNCTPVFDFRIVANEAGWVRSVSAAPGAVAQVGAPLAIVSSVQDESPEGAAARPLRVNVGVILSIVEI
jgi:pyruvate/2-oxoglutarate dehydrogenase complex dihydrolipoamide acyltransferase (E2) component